METQTLKKYSDSEKYEVKTYYSTIGWFLLTFIGMSAKPIKIEIIDKSSGKIIETITEDNLLKNFIGR